MSICPRCGKGNVAERYSLQGRLYLANVETYPNGASYVRSLHYREDCAAYTARLRVEADAEIAKEERRARAEAWMTEGFKIVDEFGKGSPEVLAYMAARPSDTTLAWA